ncbi:hypothetical protein RAS12_02000 [Achromobacter seleniivolatilans]|uniref:Knr4/Smi1-like domain-containing protein n=1 Tax=Achromobacter seleniivolatilans TaxID=3047478 RepID=A0ABY9M389_9BURK|nr:hypothetical protein [Achromobacter sp. R39]WMD21162.1 hypothetical protein RAS12_02000 [Achromobacter sp. R39]
MTSIQQVHDLFSRFGELRSQPQDLWRGDIPLPKVLAEFYERVGPWGATYHENVGPVGIALAETNISFPPLHRLWALQAGYRWDASNGQRVADWQDNWLVIADQNADPFILDTASGRILHAIHGTGAWDPGEIAPDLYTLAAALAAIGVVCLDADEDWRDDDWVVKPQHRARALLEVTQIMGSADDAGNLLDVLEL